MERIVEARGYSQGIRYHGLLLEALRKGDAARCRAVMEEHIDDTFRAMRKTLVGPRPRKG
jgi:DNA-binding GntR family transcriptional regulator